MISSIGFSIFGYFCRLGYCGVHVFANISFVVKDRAGAHVCYKNCGFLCLCITFRLCLEDILVFLLGQLCNPFG